jgi:hypothetical protein
MENSKYGEIGSFPSLVSSHLFGRFAFVVAKEARSGTGKGLVVEAFVIDVTLQRARDAIGPNPRGVPRYPRSPTCPFRHCGLDASCSSINLHAFRLRRGHLGKNFRH